MISGKLFLSTRNPCDTKSWRDIIASFLPWMERWDFKVQGTLSDGRSVEIYSTWRLKVEVWLGDRPGADARAGGHSIGRTSYRWNLLFDGWDVLDGTGALIPGMKFRERLFGYQLTWEGSRYPLAMMLVGNERKLKCGAIELTHRDFQSHVSFTAPDGQLPLALLIAFFAWSRPPEGRRNEFPTRAYPA